MTTRRESVRDHRGYFGIAVYRGKSNFNYGSLFRTAQIQGAAFLASIGPRYTPQASDVLKSWRHLPTFIYPDFDAFLASRPYDCPLVAVEMAPTAKMLCDFSHPERAIYLLGSEDNGLPPSVMAKCQSVVCLPGDRSMNVACAGTAVIVDRVMRYRR